MSSTPLSPRPEAAARNRFTSAKDEKAVGDQKTVSGPSFAPSWRECSDRCDVRIVPRSQRHHSPLLSRLSTGTSPRCMADEMSTPSWLTWILMLLALVTKSSFRMTSVSSWSTKTTVLVVEDDSALRELYRKILTAA